MKLVLVIVLFVADATGEFEVVLFHTQYRLPIKPNSTRGCLNRGIIKANSRLCLLSNLNSANSGEHHGDLAIGTAMPKFEPNVCSTIIISFGSLVSEYLLLTPSFMVGKNSLSIPPCSVWNRELT